MVFAETNLTPLIQNGIDEWVDRVSSETSHEELSEYIELLLRSYGYEKLQHLPFDSANKMQRKVMDALESGGELIYYQLQPIPSADVKLTSVKAGIAKQSERVPLMCEFLYWDDEGYDDDLETRTFFEPEKMSETIGFDYTIKQVITDGVMDLVTVWNFKDDEGTNEWWVKPPFSLYSPYNMEWPEWFVKSIEAGMVENTKV
jgi:hypothetical protein